MDVSLQFHHQIGSLSALTVREIPRVLVFYFDEVKANLSSLAVPPINFKRKLDADLDVP